MSALSQAIVMKENELTVLLREYKDSRLVLDDNNKYSILKSMITFIGSTDSELRDSLIYSSFCKMAIDKHIEHEVYNELLDYSLSDSFLFKGIGEDGTDSVFTRSFSTLLIALILYKDNEENFLSQHKVNEIKEKLILFLNCEQDVRGYVPGKGWAHSIAHVSDALDELIKNRKLEHRFFEKIVNALWHKVFVHSSVYIHDEDERILVPIFEMLNRGLKIEVVENLIQNIPIELKNFKDKLEEENYWFLVANCKTFLKSFYFALNEKSNLLSLQQHIQKCLDEI